MNAKELEKSHGQLSDVVLAMQGTIIELTARLEAATARCEAAERSTNLLMGRHEDFAATVQDVVASHDARLATLEIGHADLAGTVDDVRGKVEGRNRSAAVKRNMTDADAVRVLTGDLKDMPHKDAAEKIGLTYAQVYSCRCEFTFKHVHKELRETGWKNPHAKK